MQTRHLRSANTAFAQRKHGIYEREIRHLRTGLRSRAGRMHEKRPAPERVLSSRSGCRSCIIVHRDCHQKAEREGFEPPVPFGTTVFKTVVIDHSTISPLVLSRVRRLAYGAEGRLRRSTGCVLGFSFRAFTSSAVCRNVSSSVCGVTRNRTGDTRIFSPMLYQLSYDTMSLC